VRVLDLFCGAGGAAMGLHRAWPEAEIIGVDIEPQPRYPFTFVQADATRPPVRPEDFDFIWASPPCQKHSALVHLHPARSYACHIYDTRAMLLACGKPYVIENVPGAPLKTTFMLCGSSFGLKVRRHRIFEASQPILVPRCEHGHQGRPIDVSGTGGRRVNRRPDDHGGNTNKPRNLREAQEAIGIDWMRRRELAQAIPPAYSEFIAQQFNKSLQKGAAE